MELIISEMKFGKRAMKVVVLCLCLYGVGGVIDGGLFLYNFIIDVIVAV